MRIDARHGLRAGLAAVMLLFSVAASAGRVVPPPLPPGSHLIKVQLGESPVEKQRAERAHKHGQLRGNAGESGHAHADGAGKADAGAPPKRHLK